MAKKRNKKKVQSTKKLTKKNTPFELEKYTYWGLAAVVILFGIKLIYMHSQLIASPLPLEFREANMLATTDLLLQSKNPFALAYQPEYTNVYGIVYNWICYPFAAWGGNTLQLHRTITGFFILASLVFFFYLLKRQGVLLWQRAAASLLLYAALLYFITPMTRPDATGLFFFLLALFLPQLDNFSYRSLFLSAFLTAIAFYTKTYFLLVFPYLSAYLFLFKSKLKGIGFALMFVALFSVSILIINQLYEHYFSNVFFLHINFSNSHFDFLIKQLKEYGAYNIGLLFILFILLWHWFANFKRNRKELLDIASFNIKNWQAPLFKNQISLAFFALIASFLLFYFRMGRHTGAWMTYLFQLVTPFLLLTLFVLLKKYAKLQPIFNLLIASSVIVASTVYLPNIGRINESIAEWQSLENLVKKADNVFASPVIAPMLFAMDKRVYDTGSSEYFAFGADRKGALANFFEADTAITHRQQEFAKNLHKQLINKEFGLIILTHGYSPMLPEKAVEHYYKFLGSIPISMPHAIMVGRAQKWGMNVWSPDYNKIYNENELFSPNTSAEAKIAFFEQLLAKNPARFDAHYALALILQTDKTDVAASIRHLEKAIELNPDSEPAFRNLGISYNRLKAYKKAIPMFEKAIQLQPKAYENYRYLAVTYQLTGNMAQAQKFSAKANSLKK